MAADSEDFVILACTILIQSQSVVDRQTDPMDASRIAKMHEALHAVACEKSCSVLSFVCFDSLVCIVTCSREKSRSSHFSTTALTLVYRST